MDHQIIVVEKNVGGIVLKVEVQRQVFEEFCEVAFLYLFTSVHSFHYRWYITRNFKVQHILTHASRDEQDMFLIKELN